MCQGRHFGIVGETDPGGLLTRQHMDERNHHDPCDSWPNLLLTPFCFVP